MRLIVARCSVDYTGQLTAHLPEALRLIMLKADGSVLVHADAGGYKPLNWMTPPTAVIEDGDTITVRKIKGDDALAITLHEVVSDVTHVMDFDADRLSKDGVEADLQIALADAPHFCGEGFRLVRRQWPTDIGPVDLMCRDAERRLGRGRDQARRHDRAPSNSSRATSSASAWTRPKAKCKRRPGRPDRQAPGPRAGRSPRA